jgi:hypothetical protein
MEQKKQTGRNGGTLNVGGTFEGVGRPKKLPNLDELGAQLLSEEKSGMTALEAVIKSMIHKAVKGDTAAAKLVLDRFYGLSKQSIDHTTGGMPIQTDFKIEIMGNVAENPEPQESDDNE